MFAKYDVRQYLSKNTEFATQIFIYDFQENDASEEKAEGLAILENIFPNLESKIVQYLAWCLHIIETDEQPIGKSKK